MKELRDILFWVVLCLSGGYSLLCIFAPHVH